MSPEDYYSYDGYGVMLSDISGAEAASNAGTSLLYAGEQYDGSADMYYNRARYYDPSNGRFNRTDPYAGNTQDPQSLHKYAYCHNNPINATDPTGMWSTGEIAVTMAITSLVMTMVTAPIITHFAFKGASGDENGWPDAIIITLSGGFAGYAFSISATFHVVITLSPTFDVYLIPELEGGTAPISYSKSQSGLAFVGSIGGVWNMKSINDLTGFGFTTTIPFAAIKYGSIFFGKGSSRQAIMDFLQNFATVQRSYAKNKPTRLVAQISTSATTGASAFQVGQASTGFAFGSLVGFGITAISGRAAGDWLGDKLGNKIGQLYGIFGDIKQGSDQSLLNDRFRQVYDLFEMEG
jgi:RHS repeat-associated protein